MDLDIFVFAYNCTTIEGTISISHVVVLQTDFVQEPNHTMLFQDISVFLQMPNT